MHMLCCRHQVLSSVGGDKGVTLMSSIASGSHQRNLVIPRLETCGKRMLPSSLPLRFVKNLKEAVKTTCPLEC
ncbi:hypothetical protein HNY73_020607 [Argiope bruennichi]|uniref:Uncharacterized protein n=1 Tax=Argiope bruennichi TaxID=94029 RepID=A0A8T0E9Z4_ARGBR|nr:hypothetical protein HNY73_020607 [Argiope bruennichi]